MPAKSVMQNKKERERYSIAIKIDDFKNTIGEDKLNGIMRNFID